jgi:hypothetical protein
MNHESDEERLESSSGARAHQLRLTGRAIGASVLTFALFLGMMKLNHPLLLTRHPDQVLEQCGGAALIAFVTSWAIFSFKKPGD